LTEVNIIYYVL